MLQRDRAVDRHSKCHRFSCRFFTRILSWFYSGRYTIASQVVSRVPQRHSGLYVVNLVSQCRKEGLYLPCLPFCRPKLYSTFFSDSSTTSNEACLHSLLILSFSNFIIIPSEIKHRRVTFTCIKFQDCPFKAIVSWLWNQEWYSPSAMPFYHCVSSFSSPSNILQMIKRSNKWVHMIWCIFRPSYYYHLNDASSHFFSWQYRDSYIKDTYG